MTDTACKPLADHLVGRRAKGLVDIKFYINNPTPGAVMKACEEAATIFDAIDRGAVEDFAFNDRHEPTAA